MGFVLHHYDNSLVVEASWPEAVRPGEPRTFAARWRNAGVAPCLPGGPVALTLTLTLKDERDGIAAVLVDRGLDARTLPVGPSGEAEAVAREASLRLPAQVKPGTYDLFVSIGSAIGTPVIALPHDGDDGQGRVPLGQVRVLPQEPNDEARRSPLSSRVPFRTLDAEAPAPSPSVTGTGSSSTATASRRMAPTRASSRSTSAPASRNGTSASTTPAWAGTR